MPHTAIKFGRVLILLGLIGYAIGFYNGYASPTAMIPAAFGIALLILGYIARNKENLRKHLMHVAIIIAFIGFLAPAWRLVSKFNDLSLSPATASQAIMALICLTFVVLGIRTFVNARSDS